MGIYCLRVDSSGVDVTGFDLQRWQAELLKHFVFAIY